MQSSAFRQEARSSDERSDVKSGRASSSKEGFPGFVLSGTSVEIRPQTLNRQQGLPFLTWRGCAQASRAFYKKGVSIVLMNHIYICIERRSGPGVCISRVLEGGRALSSLLRPEPRGNVFRSASGYCANERGGAAPHMIEADDCSPNSDNLPRAEPTAIRTY